jgi:dinuclear metal center YbgI/SA1388 family protein
MRTMAMLRLPAFAFRSAVTLFTITGMPTVDTITKLLEQLAPPALAESWDNVGLLVGDRARNVKRLMTCLTVTPASAREAMEAQADLIVTHHPLPFQPVRQLTTDTTTGRLLWDLIGARIAIYSPHTAFDSAQAGINAYLAEGLALKNVAPLVAAVHDATEGAGRHGDAPPATTLASLARTVKSFLKLDVVRVVGTDDQQVTRIGIACGSGGSLLEKARLARCDAFLTGETNFHTCLEAESRGIALVLTGHFASERFAVERLADWLATQLSDVEVWASRDERDPLRSV